MNHRLDQNCHIPLGTRDAVHVPFVVGRASWGKSSLQERMDGMKPGAFVRFVDEKFVEFVLCAKEEAHGIINPFLDEVSYYDSVVVMLIPGITTPVVHHFEINPKQKELEQQILQSELELAKESDPPCAGCYVIRNNEVIRN